MKNVKLTNLEAYKGYGDEWYLKIVYQYESEDGLHQRVFPRVIPPFPQGDIPTLNIATNTFNSLDDRDYLMCNDKMVLWPGEYSTCIDGSEVSMGRRATMFDICLSKHEPKEMTLDEIEKELGYKVKIISKEEGDVYD